MKQHDILSFSLALIALAAGITACSALRHSPVMNAPDRPEPLATSGRMGVVEIAASQTALAKLVPPTPAATLLPGLVYWVPSSTGRTSLYFLYDSTRWALTDASTLASLEITGCTLRRAGGRGLGPGWSTEQSTLKTESVPFLVIVAKFQGQTQFVTYSGPDDNVFEITAPSQPDSCIQAGENVIKSVSVY